MEDGPAVDRVRRHLADARERSRDGDSDAAEDALAAAVDAAEDGLDDSVVERIAFGCERVRATMASDHGVASEYLRSMERLLEETE